MLKTVQSTQCSNIQSMGRRAFLERLCGGLGAVGLTGMLASDLRASNIPFGPVSYTHLRAHET